MQYLGVDPLQAGNVVQLVLVLGLTVGWISTYIFRVSNKEMTYAQQLRDYEDKVMQVKFPTPSFLVCLGIGTYLFFRSQTNNLHMFSSPSISNLNSCVLFYIWIYWVVQKYNCKSLVYTKNLWKKNLPERLFRDFSLHIVF